MTDRCAIWDTDANKTVSTGDRIALSSSRAGGSYEISRSAVKELNNVDLEAKARLTTWLVDQRRAGNEQPIISTAEISLAQTSRMLSVSERRDRLLLAVNHIAPRLGEGVNYQDSDSERDELLAWTESVELDELGKLVEFAESQHLLDDEHIISLTLDGYTHLDRLLNSPKNSKQAFVAMWFNDEVTDAYLQGIEPAILEAGYLPMRIDKKEHNNKIDDEIIAEIKRSMFVIADFTCGLFEDGKTKNAIHRGGVYYEAGFAQGLGIPVIWTCREDQINLVHFDTRQFNHVTWSNPQELKQKLLNRIGAVIGDGPLKSI